MFILAFLGKLGENKEGRTHKSECHETHSHPKVCWLFTARKLRWRLVEPGLYREDHGGPGTISLVFAFFSFSLRCSLGGRRRLREERERGSDYHATTLNRQTFHISQYIRLRLPIDTQWVRDDRTCYG